MQFLAILDRPFMPEPSFTDDEIIAFLEEMLPPDRMSAFEVALRDSEELRQRFAGISRRRDQGAHTVGEIWRRRRLSCPTRSDLGSLLLGTLDSAQEQYLDFHLRTIGCRYCIANLADLEGEINKSDDAPRRRKKFFESSAGYLSPLRQRPVASGAGWDDGMVFSIPQGRLDDRLSWITP